MTDKIYKGSLTFCLRKDLPADVMDRLVNLKNKTVKDKKIDIEDLVDSGYDFSLACLTDYSYDSFDFSFLKPENTNMAKGYCLFVDVSSSIYFDGVIYDFIDYLRPYLIEDAPNYLGVIENEDASFKNEFYVNEAFMKNDLLQFIQNMKYQNEIDDLEDNEYKLGYSIALDIVRGYILRKKE